MATSELNILKLHCLLSSKESSELFLPSQNAFTAAEKRPQQLATGKASHSAAGGFLSGVCGFPEYKRRDLATV